MAHPLHEIIGRHLTETNFPACKVLKDPACGGEQHLPLFVSSKKSRKTKYCNVDILVFQNNRVRVIIETQCWGIKSAPVYLRNRLF